MANGKKVKSKATKGSGDKKRTAAGGSGTGMSLKKTLKSVPSDGGRPRVMAQKKGGQGKKMMKTMTRRTVPKMDAVQKIKDRTPMRNAAIDRLIRGIVAND